MPKLLSAFAAVISSCRTVLGSSASRLGRCSDPAAASSPESTKISQIRGSPTKVFTASATISSAWATPVLTRSRRRSTWSASAPPYRPKTISGASSTRPIMPTAMLEPVSL